MILYVETRRLGINMTGAKMVQRQNPLRTTAIRVSTRIATLVVNLRVEIRMSTATVAITKLRAKTEISGSVCAMANVR